MKCFESEYWDELPNQQMGDVRVEEEREGMNTFPNWNMKNAIWFISLVVSIPSQHLWFSDYSFPRDRKKNETISLEAFYILGEVNQAQALGYAYKVSGEVVLSLKLKGEESFHPCHHPTFQTNRQRGMRTLFFLLKQHLSNLFPFIIFRTYYELVSVRILNIFHRHLSSLLKI